MLKIIIPTILILLSFPSFAKSKLILLTSFEKPERKPLSLSRKRQDLFDGVEEIFTEAFQKDYDLEIIHEANPFVLFNKVSSGAYDGIFWISHSNKGMTFSRGMSSDDIVLTSKNVDVKDIFFHLHPRTSFLSLIGCYSESFAEALQSFSKSSNQHFIGFNKKVDILRGLRRSIKKFKKLHIEENQIDSFVKPADNVMTFKIHRNAGQEILPSLFIYNRGKLLDVIPKLSAYSSSTHEISIEDVKTAQDLKIIIATNKVNPLQISPNDFGEIELMLLKGGIGNFEVLKVGSKEVGTRTRIFKFTGDI